MMRKYSNKKNVQLRNYYEDRFYHTPQIKKIKIEGSLFEEDFRLISQKFNIKDSFIELDFWVIEIEKDDNIEVLKELKILGYEAFIDASAIDFVEQKQGFEVYYQLLNIEKKIRVRIKTFVALKDKLQSVMSVFKGANWCEREIYDMFGIFIVNHTNLKRILMPDDWYGHPFLKTYPLEGDEFAKWYEIDKIFGKEYREIVGEENRDPGFVDEKDTLNFSRIYHEVAKGDAPRKDKYLQEYQEEGGVLFVKKIKRNEAKILDKRR